MSGFFHFITTLLNLNRRSMTALLTVAMTGVLAAPFSESYSQRFTDNEVKAALVFKIPIYVRWPESAMNDDVESFKCCIIGEDPLVKFLTQFNDETLMGKTIRVKRVSDTGSFGECHLLFVCESEKRKLAEIMKSIESKPVLTIGNMNGFTKSGGIINLIMQDDSVHFEINPEAGKKAGLEINSKLLRIAKITKSN